MYCGECGYKNEKGAKFCEKCGSKLEVPKENKVKKTNKTEKKGIHKILIIALLVVVIGIGGLFGYKYYTEHKSTGTKWGDSYYEFLRDHSDKLFDDSKVSFIDVSEIKEPVMLVKGTKDKKNYTDIYYLNKGVVKSVKRSKPASTKLLYNIESKKYDWYLETNEDKKETYTPIVNKINNNSKEKEYTFEENEEVSQDKLDGTKITLAKKSTVFVETNVEPEEIEIKDDIKAADLQKNIENTVKDYKETDKLVTKDVKSKVEEEVTTVENTQKSMEDAKKEIEEEKKRQEEEAAKGVKVGNYTLRYGKYTEYCGGEQMDGYLRINRDGTCEMAFNNGFISTSICRYSVGSVDLSQDISSKVVIPGLIITGGEYKYSYGAGGNDLLTDGDVCEYKYTG